MSTVPNSQYYDEGFRDGQEYQSQNPGLDEHGLTHVQRQLEDINLHELGHSEAENGQYIVAMNMRTGCLPA
jgi:hypothetical protein